MKDASIVLFGDSYTAGRIPHTQTDGAFAAHLINLHSNYALSGSTAAQWCQDIDGRLTTVRLSGATVAVGSLLGNDALAAIADGHVEEAESIPALAALTMVLFRISRWMPVLLMLYPNPYPAKPLIADGVARLNRAIGCVASVVNTHDMTHPVMLLDLGTVLKPEHFDGLDIHPSPEGYKAMADAVMGVIDRM